MLKPGLRARRLGPCIGDFHAVLRREWPGPVRMHLLPVWQEISGGIGFDTDVAIKPLELSGFEGPDGRVSVAGLLAPVAGPLNIDAMSEICLREGVPHLPIALADGGHFFIPSGDGGQVFLWLRDAASDQPRFSVVAPSLGDFIDALSAREPIETAPHALAESGHGLDELFTKTRRTQ